MKKPSDPRKRKDGSSLAKKFSAIAIMVLMMSQLFLAELDARPGGLSIETSSIGKRYLVYDGARVEAQQAAPLRRGEK